jgi:hypothetical protein
MAKAKPVTMDNRTIWDALDRDVQVELRKLFPILQRRSLNGS